MNDPILFVWNAAMCLLAIGLAVYFATTGEGWLMLFSAVIAVGVGALAYESGRRSW